MPLRYSKTARKQLRGHAMRRLMLPPSRLDETMPTLLRKAVRQIQRRMLRELQRPAYRRQVRENLSSDFLDLAERGRRLGLLSKKARIDCAVQLYAKTFAADATGVIVHAYPGGDAYEIEMLAADGTTLAVRTETESAIL